MGIFSNIIEGIKDTVSYITDTSTDIMGNAIDYLKHSEQQITRPVEPSGIGGIFDFEDDSYLYDDYIDWIHEAWY